VKILISSGRRPIKLASGPNMTPQRMVGEVRQAVGESTYDVVSVGYPGIVRRGKPVSEPRNLAPRWVGFNFQRAFGRPVKVINDAAMQALGSYKGGRLLFLGLGTGFGSALIVNGELIPMELGHLPYRKGRTYEEYVGKAGLKRLGRKRWRRHVVDVITSLTSALEIDDVVLGGGNAKLLDSLPRGVRRGSNANAFIGGVRLWQDGRASGPDARGRAR